MWLLSGPSASGTKHWAGCTLLNSTENPVGLAANGAIRKHRDWWPLGGYGRPPGQRRVPSWGEPTRSSNGEVLPSSVLLIDGSQQGGYVAKKLREGPLCRVCGCPGYSPQQMKRTKITETSTPPQVPVIFCKGIFCPSTGRQGPEAHINTHTHHIFIGRVASSTHSVSQHLCFLVCKVGWHTYDSAGVQRTCAELMHGYWPWSWAEGRNSQLYDE